MNIVIFDTETTSLEKPFCYNIGYVIGNEHGETLLKHDFVVEQIWHNLPLFSSAYYADKRALYIDAMRARLAVLDKFRTTDCLKKAAGDDFTDITSRFWK